MITLYEFRASPYCGKVRKVLEFKKLPFEAVEVSFLARRQPRELSGQGKVPVIKDGDRVVADSTAIALYLEERYPEPPILPRDGAARARAMLLEDWVDETFADSAVPAKMLPPGNAERVAKLSTEAQGNPWLLRTLQPFAGMVLRSYIRRRRQQGRTLERIRKDFEGHLDLVEQALAGADFVAGDAPTLPDFAIYGFLSTMDGLEGFEVVPRRPRLWAWYGRMKGL